MIWVITILACALIIGVAFWAAWKSATERMRSQSAKGVKL